METPRNALVCDGCGLPASEDHIAERIRRLELSTKYRPVHINNLFVSLAPPDRVDDDFYSPSAPPGRYAKFRELGEISSNSEGASETGDQGTHNLLLQEFQRKGGYLVYLSECPRDEEETLSATISRLAPTLVRRIRFNYKPKTVTLLEEELSPLIGPLMRAGIDQILTLNQGSLIPIPGTASGAAPGD